MSKASKIVSMAVLLLTLVALSVPSTNVAKVVAQPVVSDVWVAPPPLGNNSNSGIQAQPFASIQWGIDHVAPTGTVHVAAGTYYENLEIGKSSTMTGSDARTTIIDGKDSGRVLHIASYIGQTNAISGLTIQNGRISWGCPGMPVGGGVYVASGHAVTLNDCTIRNNTADFLGGGVYNAGQITLNRCTLNGNSAGMVGGGIANFVDEKQFETDGSMSLVNCTIYGNIVGGTSLDLSPNLVSMGGVGPPLPSLSLGGGVYNGGDASFLNVTIDNNTVSAIAHPTVSGNTVTNTDVLTFPEPRGGGFANLPLQCTNDNSNPIYVPGTDVEKGVVIYTPTATFKNTIVASNVPDNGYNYYGDVISSGHNLDSENSCGFNQPTDLINTNPLLGALQDNGGPTFTQALLHGSPAIDSGESAWTPPMDQRGVPRPQGPAFDIGAYELAQASAVTATGAGTASFSTLNGYITDLTGLNASQVECGPLPNFDFPYGLFSFNVTDITPGSTVTIVIILPTNAPEDTQYWKCIDGEWVDCTSLLGSNDGDQILTLTITDGELGDRDGLANGQISDPGGPALATAIQWEPKVSPTLPRLLNPPQMSVQYLSVSPQQAAVNQPVTISTNVVNTGDQGGNLNVALKINGRVEQTRMVSVGPLASQQVKFTVTRTDPGTYSVDIGGQTASFTIPDSRTNKGAPVNGGVIVLLVIGMLVLASIMVVILSRRPA